MIGIHHYWLFLISGILLNLTPGQDTMYVIGRSLAGGKQLGIASALGINAGTLVHTALAAFGLSTILAASAIAFSIVKCIGAAYLIYLGVRLLRSRHKMGLADAIPDKGTRWKAFRQGMITNVLNPKVALFFLAFLPQFIDTMSVHHFVPFLILGCTFAMTGTLWCMTLALCASAFRSFFVRYPNAHTVLDRCVGGLFLLLGARLATSTVN